MFAKTALGLLLSAHKQGGLEGLPGLSIWLEEHGEAAIGLLSERVTEDAEVLADLVAPPKFFKPLADAPGDARIAKQYDPTATPMML